MNLLFANLFLAPLLALASLPVLIHLIARVRPTLLPFSSILFLQNITRQRHRMKKPRQWLLLILRTLLILLLALMFMRPVYYPEQAWAQDGEQRNVVILVDASASMNYVEGGRSRFASACVEASEILDGLGAGDRANVVWVKFTPEAIYPEPGENRVYLIEQLKQAECSQQPASPELAVQLALDQLSDLEGRKELVILSDFQRTNWDNALQELSGEIKLSLLTLAHEPSHNIAITQLWCEPAFALPFEPVTFFCEVANFSPESQTTTVHLNAGEHREAETLTLAPWDNVVVPFQLDFARAGSLPVFAQLSEDAYAQDNRRATLLRVSESLPVGLSGDDPADPQFRFLKRALNSLEWVEISDRAEQVMAHFQVTHQPVFNQDTTDDEADSQIPWIWLPPSEGTIQAEPLAGLLSGQGASQQESWAVEETREPFRITLSMPDDPIFEVFNHGEFGDPAHAVFAKRRKLPPELAEHADVLIRYQDALPALMRFGKQGYLWNMPLEDAPANLATMPEFLPLIGELLLNLRKQNQTAATEYLIPGLTTHFRASVEHLGGGEVHLYNSHDVAQPLTGKPREDGMDYLSEPLDEPGVYRWEQAGKTIDYEIVTFPAIESDLRTLEPDSISEGSAVKLVSGRSLAQMHDGIELWTWLLAAAIILTLIEGSASVLLSRKLQ